MGSPNPSPPAHPNPPVRLPSSGGEPGKRQRLRHSIPTPQTILQLGAKLAGSSPFGFDGLSLLSSANLFAKVAEKTFLDLLGTTVFQSHEELQHWSTGDMHLNSGSNLGMFARGRMLISTAFGAEASQRKEAGEKEDLEPHDVAEHHERVETETEKLQLRYSSIADMIGDVKKLVFLSAPVGKEKWGKFFVSNGLFAYSKWKKSTSAEPSSELTLFGKEGVGIISPEEVSIMAEEGAKIFGAQEVKMTGLEVAIEAGAEAKVFAIGEATFEAGGYADVRAGREVGISALHGPVDIKGRTIEIGKHVRNLNQDRTTEITASAAEMIELHAEKIEIGAKEKPKAAPSSNSNSSKLREHLAPTVPQEKAKEVSVEAREAIKLDSDKVIDLKAKEQARFRVGNFTIVVTEKKVSLGLANIEGGDPKRAFLTIDERGEVVVESKGARLRLGDDVGVLAASAGGSEVRVKGDQTFIDGRKVNIG